MLHAASVLEQDSRVLKAISVFIGDLTETGLNAEDIAADHILDEELDQCRCQNVM